MKRKEIVSIIIGTFCMAAATNTVFQPFGIVTGGFGGLGIIFDKLWSIPLWMTNVMLNVPLFILAFRYKTKKFMARTICSDLMLTAFLAVLPRFSFFPKDFYVNLILGAILMGIGLGLVMKERTSTGGTDLMAFLLHVVFPHMSIPMLLGMLDGIIVLFGAFIFGVEKTSYALLVIYGITKITDSVVEGFQVSKLVFVISHHQEQISEQILFRMGRGATKLSSVGAYTGQSKETLMCIVSKKEVPVLKKIVMETDPKAFVIISDTRETIGEGFVDYTQ